MEKLTVTVGVRLTAEEYAALQAEAEKQDRKVSWIARKKLREAMKT